MDNIIHLDAEKLRRLKDVEFPDAATVQIDAAVLNAYLAGWDNHPGNAKMKLEGSTECEDGA